MDKSIIIIGAGIAGLSAGCYGQMNDYRTQIFEMDNARPGGLCTSWKRKGYIIDGCMHWLLGSKPGTGFYCIWEELGAVQGEVPSPVTPPPGCRFHTRCPKVMKICSKEPPTLRPLAEGHLVSCHLYDQSNQ